MCFSNLVLSFVLGTSAKLQLNSLLNLFQVRIHWWVMEKRPYLADFLPGTKRQPSLAFLVLTEEYTSSSLRKSFWKHKGSDLLTKSWIKMTFLTFTISSSLRILLSLNKGLEVAFISLKFIILSALFWSLYAASVWRFCCWPHICTP